MIACIKTSIGPIVMIYETIKYASSLCICHPVTPDDFSLTAANALLSNTFSFQFLDNYKDVCFRLSIKATQNNSLNATRELRKELFSCRAEEEGLQLPKIHLVINSRVPEYELRQVVLN